jgi:enoyl-CoA hydratase
MSVLLPEDFGAVRVLSLNRPDSRNALTMALMEAILDALRYAEADATIGAVVLTGSGRGFCAGADLVELRDPAQRHLAERRSELNQQLQTTMSTMTKPVVAAINGAAAGSGAAIALGCDLIVMTASAKLGYPEIRHGIAPTMMVPNLVRQVGLKVAFELLSLGELIPAQRAWEIGLANRVVPDDELLTEAVRIAGTLAAANRSAMATTKRLFYEAADQTFEAALASARAASRQARAANAAGTTDGLIKARG